MNKLFLATFSFVFFAPHCLGTVIWDNTAITNSVTDEDIIIRNNNTLVNDIAVTADTTNVTITIDNNASLSDNNNGFTLSLITTSTERSIVVNIAGNTLTLKDTITFKHEKSVTLWFDGGILRAQNSAAIVAGP